MSFVHLHVHSEYSLLDGYSNISRMVQRAKEMGMPALALTDHGTMFGVIDFFNAAKPAYRFTPAGLVALILLVGETVIVIARSASSMFDCASNA